MTRTAGAIPASVRVGTYVYTVTVGPTDDYGATNHRRGTITIADDLHPQASRDTLLHEVLHCVHHAAGNLFPAAAGDDEGQTEENVVRLWTGPLLGVLRDNPDLIAYLTEGDR